jgi:hypothetical protein
MPHGNSSRNSTTNTKPSERLPSENVVPSTDAHDGEEGEGPLSTLAEESFLNSEPTVEDFRWRKDGTKQIACGESKRKFPKVNYVCAQVSRLRGALQCTQHRDEESDGV